MSASGRCIWLGTLLLTVSCLSAQEAVAIDATRSTAIRELLEETLAEEKLPGLIGAIVGPEGVQAIACAGVRKVGDDTPITVDDVIHIGSCTKAMTCTMLATLVAEGKLTWETTLAEGLPELAKDIHPTYRKVTLWQLVTHRAGVPANPKNWAAHRELAIGKRRLAILRDGLRKAPKTKVGEYLYSNLGYVAASCLAEAATGSTWEELVRERVFVPLGMISAGFGPPGTAGKVDQPWGHHREGKKWSPLQFDNPEAIGPAGRVHCTVWDWAKFIVLQLPDKEPPILDRERLDRQVEPVGNYAGGWIVVERPWAKGKVYIHNGSNTTWYTLLCVAPELDRAYLVAGNAFDEPTTLLCERLMGKLIKIDRPAE